MQAIDHKTILAGLSVEARTALLERSDAAGLRHLALHLGAIALCSFLILLQVPLLPLVLLIQGLLICFLFTTLHECVHQTPFRSEALNVWVGRLCGFLVFLGPEWFRYFHFAHHRFTHDPDRDPELASPKPRTAWQYLVYISGLPDWIGRLRTLLRNAFRPNEDNYVPARGKAKVMAEARVLLALYVVLIALSLLLWTPVLIYLWLLPYLLGGPFLRCYLLAEHTRCPHVASMLENTRTTFTNSIVRFLAWNMPYHVEHHAYPSVPFHKLPAFHEHTRAHIVHSEQGYARFNGRYLRDSMTGRLEGQV